MNNKPAIVVVGYNRPDSIKKLLNSIAKADYICDDINLIISVDYEESLNNEEVVRIAKNFDWKYGNKKVITHKINLGLKNHILKCGHLTQIYGAIILLEDDLRVSNKYYEFATSALEYYFEHPKIAGISLYSYEYDELSWSRFYPHKKGTDTYFIQWTCSWGQLWTKSQWSGFIKWFNKNKDRTNFNVPSQVNTWENSWKKYNIAYIVENNLFYVYPYNSYTNLRDGNGVHHLTDSKINSVQLYKPSIDRDYFFSNFEEIDLKYDVYFQPFKRVVFVEELSKEIELEFDLFGNKPTKNVDAAYLCSINQPKNIISKYSNKLIPYEINIIESEYGDFYYLALKEDFNKKPSLIMQGKSLYYSRKILRVKEMGLIILFKLKTYILKR